MDIGFVGLGIMGAPMCGNILRKHDGKVYVFNRTQAKTEPLVKMGAVLCGSAREAAEKTDIFITMVSRSEDSRQVYESVLPALGPGKLCIDMSTIDPNVSRELAAMVKAAGADFIDAPVVKSRPAAEAGKLGIYMGGPEAACERALPILQYMGENIIRMGENGCGLVMKICHNALVSQIQNGVNETSALAAKNGIDIMTFARAISYGGGQNFYLDSKKQSIADENYAAAFSIRNMHKDLGICLDLASASGLSMPGEENAKRVYDAAMAEGLGEEDFCATVKIVREQRQ